MWLQRTHEASKKRAYQGTFVVTSALGMSSSKIWAVCDGTQQMERVEALTGPPRNTLRHNQTVVTFMPDVKVARTEQRDSIGLFPSISADAFASLAEFYAAKSIGAERVAGVDAEIVQLTPRDQLRYGYRVWSEKKTGLVVKVQTLDESGTKVLEQAAFSDLQLNAPVRMEQLSAQMKNTAGYRMEREALVKTTAAAEGWGVRSTVPGYRPNGCHKRVTDSASGAESMQWVFTDGLASVSLFVEAFDAKRHKDESQISMGSTNTLSRKVEGAYWLIAMGEVPMTTLRAFASALYRR
jgi:sigma-E factor negative regulatory protein RseB